MNTSSAVFILGLLSAGALCLLQPEPRIEGGDKASEGQFTYTVSLQFEGQHKCGGAIIGDFHVLTTAVCCDDYLSLKPEIEVGSVLLGRGKTLQAENLYIHPNYNNITGKHDICVIETKESLKTNSSSTIISLGGAEDCKAGTECNITGWGSINDAEDMIENLVFAQVPIHNQKSCTRYVPLFDSNTMLCSGGVHGDTGACKGDNGIPLACEERLCGIFSFGHACGSHESPGVFTKVSAYKQWIEETMTKAKPKAESLEIY